LPYDFNCTEKEVDLTVTFSLTCQGPNANDSSTLCPAVFNELVTAGNQTNVTAPITLLYSFCPEYQRTFLVPTSFELYNEDGDFHHGPYHKKSEQRSNDWQHWDHWDRLHLVHNYGEVHEYRDVFANMTFETIRSVNGSFFQSAKIVAVHIAEVVKSAESVRHVDVTTEAKKWPGKVTTGGPHDIVTIAFRYYPDFELITTYLQNWAQGLYFYVEVDVSYAPTSLSKRATKQTVKLQLQPDIQKVMNAARIERTNANSEPFALKAGTQEIAKPIAKAPVKNIPSKQAPSNNNNDELARESEKAARMFSIIGASAGSAMLVVVACLVVVVSVLLRKKPEAVPTN